MATIDSNVMTMADVARHRDPNGAAVRIIEILNKTNEIIKDAPTIQCNNGTTHITTYRDEIPRPEFRMINQGTSTVKSAVRKMVESTAVIEAWAEVDDALLLLSKNPSEILLSESKAVLEGMAQFATEKLIYGTIANDPAGFDGFAKRYNSLDVASFPEARNIIDAGGTGADLSSIWIIQWHDLASHMIYPEGAPAGIKHEVFKNQVMFDSVGKKLVGTRVHYYWYLGLAVRDWRRVVRIANVDTAQLQTIIDGGAASASDQKLIRLLIEGIDLLPNRSFGRTMIYMNRRPHTMLNIMAMEKSNVNLTYEKFAGEPNGILAFLGIPIRRVDGMIVGEDQVVA